MGVGTGIGVDDMPLGIVHLKNHNHLNDDYSFLPFSRDDDDYYIPFFLFLRILGIQKKIGERRVRGEDR